MSRTKMDGKQLYKYADRKKKLRKIAIILFIVSGSLLVFGLTNIFLVITNPAQGETYEEYQRNVDRIDTQTFIGIISTALGLVILWVGSNIYMSTRLRDIAEYTVTEMAPATTIAAKAFTTGIQEAGGLTKSDTVTGKPIEVIRIKCRKCGYLETEDATFCSKCGEAL